MGRVFYITNRTPDNPAAPTSFGIDFNGPVPGGLTFGVADIAAPPGHGPTGLPNEAPNQQSVQISDAAVADFSAAAKEQILAGPPHLILSVHGFQYLFWEAMARADYLSRWFNEGPYANPNTMIAFSWPSAGKLGQYPRDWSYATSSGAGLAEALLAVRPLIDAFRRRHLEASRITLLAHSMGNHVLDAALAGGAPGTPPPTYNRIILVAADEDRNQLTAPGKLAAARQLGDRVYVYYNNQDVALAISNLVFHEFVVRLGVEGAPNKGAFKGSNLCFINASAAGAGNPANPYDSEGHQYYRMIPEMRNDICAVMRGMVDGAIPNRIYRDDPRYDWENYWRVDTTTIPTS
jgi:esterase/lipase superfamily enzyme